MFRNVPCSWFYLRTRKHCVTVNTKYNTKISANIEFQFIPKLIYSTWDLLSFKTDNESQYMQIIMGLKMYLLKFLLFQSVVRGIAVVAASLRWTKCGPLFFRYDNRNHLFEQFYL